LHYYRYVKIYCDIEHAVQVTATVTAAAKRNPPTKCWKCKHPGKSRCTWANPELTT